MKYKVTINLLLALGLMLALSGGSSLAQDATVSGEASIDAVVGTGFTYQGRLTQSGNPVTGACDFQFSLWSAASGGSQVGSTQTKTNVALSAGNFDVTPDFGASAFQGDARYLQIAVRCPAGSGSYTTLSGRVALNATPYALGLRPGAVIQGSGTALSLSTTATSGFALIVTAPGTTAIYGQSASATGAGVFGFNTNAASGASGVVGLNSGNGNGVEGQTVSGHGVHGKANPPDGFGVYSEGNAYVDGNLFWQGKTGYVTVSAAAFGPVDESYMYTNWGNSLRPKNLASRYYYAPMQLPHGATVNRITFYWSDDSGDFNGRCYLYRDNMTGGGDALGSVDTSGQSGAGSSTTTAISNATVDNSRYAYYLGWDLAGGGDVTGYGAIVQYTFYEPY